MQKYESNIMRSIDEQQSKKAKKFSLYDYIVLISPSTDHLQTLLN